MTDDPRVKRQHGDEGQEQSSTGRDEIHPPSLLGLQRALMALWDAPELRTGKVAALRQAIARGSYTVSPEQIADAMLRQWVLR